MRTGLPFQFRRRAARAAFSLIEIIVVVGLLSVIILGLLAMFTQTQKVFRVGLTQSDVLESGRMATEMISRELEQTAPSRLPNFVAAPPYLNAPVNFFAWLPNLSPLYQPMPGSNERRTNLLEDVFFISKRNQEWIGIGYFVRTTNPVSGRLDPPTVTANGTPSAGVGTLYRFEASAQAISGRTPGNLYNEFYAAAYQKPNALPVSKIMDGVIHFRVRAFNTNGVWIDDESDVSATQRNSDVRYSTTVAPDEIGQYYFFSNAVPASVELELGILENRAWERFNALPSDTAKYNYIAEQAGRVHLFRQRVGIRNVDPKAYQ